MINSGTMGKSIARFIFQKFKKHFTELAIHDKDAQAGFVSATLQNPAQVKIIAEHLFETADGLQIIKDLHPSTCRAIYAALPAIKDRTPNSKQRTSNGKIRTY